MIASAYKALARKFHPDTALIDPRVAGQKMAELNWAKRELDQNHFYWSNVSRIRSLNARTLAHQSHLGDVTRCGDTLALYRAT